MAKALITGGCEGIGFELAKCFAEDGIDVILTARDADKLRTAAAYLTSKYSVSVQTVIKDLAASGAPQELYEEVKDEDVQYLVNNAGMGTKGKSWEIPAEEDEKLISLNDTAVTILTKLFLKDMLKKDAGTIMNVSSTGAFQPGPYIASYYASKAYVYSYTLAVAEEVMDTSVHVCCLCPGPVSTGFYEKSGQKIPAIAMPADRCAAYAYEKMKQKKTVIIPGAANKLARMIPDAIAVKYVKNMKKDD